MDTIKRKNIERELASLVNRARDAWNEENDDKVYKLLRRVVDRMEILLKDFPEHSWGDVLSYCQTRLGAYESRTKARKLHAGPRAPYGDLYDYRNGKLLRTATHSEEQRSIHAAESDGGLGLIVVDDVTCYVN